MLYPMLSDAKFPILLHTNDKNESEAISLKGSWIMNAK